MRSAGIASETIERKRIVSGIQRGSCSDVACRTSAVVPFMVARKTDDADVCRVKAQVTPAPLADDVVEVVDSRFVDCDTAQFAKVRAVIPYLREQFTLTRVAGLAGLYGFGDCWH